MLNPMKCDEIQKNHVTFPIRHDHVSDASKIRALKLSYLKCQIIGANELLDQQEVAFSKHMHMAT